VVYSNDRFELEFGTAEHLTHVPNIVGDRGKRLGVYMHARLKDDTDVIEFLTVADVEKVRAFSKAKDKGPWKDWEDQMWRKSAVRAGSKFLPLSPEDARLIAREELEEHEDREISQFLDLSDGSTLDVEAVAERGEIDATRERYQEKKDARASADQPAGDQRTPELECCDGIVDENKSAVHSPTCANHPEAPREPGTEG
jgi:recombination protein RecT